MNLFASIRPRKDGKYKCVFSFESGTIITKLLTKD